MNGDAWDVSDRPLGTEAGSPDLEAALRRHFGFRAFLPRQRAVIESVMAGRNTLAVMPTGAGKSLCFQLPALLLPGLTLVVSPLIALMKDQVDQLVRRGIAAGCLNSAVDDGQRRRVFEQLRSGALKILYVAPERLRVRTFLEALASTPVGLVAIDEAHCISEWGHDFRPDYTRLGDLRLRLRPPVTLALTATATPRVRADILASLAMDDAATLVAGFDRPNLHLEVRRVRSRRQKVEAILEHAPSGPGLVYTATRKQADLLTVSLRSQGIGAEVYHAGIDPAERARIQDGFMQGRTRVLVATNAFGMGIDKADIRFVIHAQIPRSIEAYYQEIGRAGRDRRPARATLLFNHADVFLQERMLSLSFPPAGVLRDLWELLRFEPVVRTPSARLALRLGTSEERVQAALKLLERAGHLERGTAVDGAAVIELLPGLAPPPAGQAGRVLEVLRRRLGDGGPQEVFLEELLGETGLPAAAVRRALGALAQRQAIAFRPPPRERALAILDLGLPVSQLRVDLAAVDRRARHVQSLLKSISRYAYSRACYRRFILEYFGEVPPRRCASCANCGPAKGARPGAADRPREESSAEVTHALFSSGVSVEEVARLRGLATATIYIHLAACARRGRLLPLERLVSPALLGEILEAHRRRPGARLAELRAEVPGATYDQLRLVLAADEGGAAALSPRSPDSAQPAGTNS